MCECCALDLCQILIPETTGSMMTGRSASVKKTRLKDDDDSRRFKAAGVVLDSHRKLAD